MILDSKLDNKNNIKVGDVLFFSDCCAYLILDNQDKFEAIQILNNGNEELGYICYDSKSINELVKELIDEMESNPIKIVHMSDIKISID